MIISLFFAVSVLLFLGMPVAFALAGSTVFAVLVSGDYSMLVVFKEMFTGLNSFPLMAVPFFILAAELMSSGALSAVLLKFSTQFVGHFRGGLGYANIVSLTVFSGISGSALADAAGPGSILIRMMEKSGYTRAYPAALTASVAILGPIIPPSIIMIVYALQDERVSVLGLFWAGVLPGLLIAVAMASVNWYVCKRRDYRGHGRMPPLREILVTTWKAIPALAMIVIIIGGIRIGAFTPTEASVVAVFYALLCGKFVYRSLRWEALPGILARSAMLTGSVLMLLAASAAFAWLLTIEGIPQKLTEIITDWNMSALGFLFVVNILLLLFGIFMEPMPGVMILVPILAPLSASLGIDPIHFAMVVILNLSLGMISPPVGSLLSVVCSSVNVKMGALTRELTPFLLAHVVVLALLTVFPWISTWLPKLMGT